MNSEPVVHSLDSIVGITAQLVGEITLTCPNYDSNSLEFELQAADRTDATAVGVVN